MDVTFNFIKQGVPVEYPEIVSLSPMFKSGIAVKWETNRKSVPKFYYFCTKCGRGQSYSSRDKNLKCQYCGEKASPHMICDRYNDAIEGREEEFTHYEWAFKTRFDENEISVKGIPHALDITVSVQERVKKGIVDGNKYVGDSGYYSDFYVACLHKLVPYLYEDYSLATQVLNEVFKANYSPTRSWTAPTKEELIDKINKEFPQWCADILWMTPKNAKYGYYTDNRELQVPSIIIEAYRYLMLHDIATLKTVEEINDDVVEDLLHGEDPATLARVLMQYTVRDGQYVISRYRKWKDRKIADVNAGLFVSEKIYNNLTKRTDIIKRLQEHACSMDYETLRAAADAMLEVKGEN